MQPDPDDDLQLGPAAAVVFDAVFVHVDGRIVEVNEVFERMFGYSADEATGGLTVFDIFDSDYHDLLVERIRQESSERYELVGITRDGDGRHMEVCGRTIRRGDRSARLVAVHDLTERRLAEEQVGVLAFQYAADLTAVSDIARRLPRTADAAGAREAICEGALAVCDGMIAVLMEPDGTGHLVSTAVAGADAAPMRVPLDAEGSATARVFLSGEPFFLADLSGEHGLSRRVVDATGAVSALWQPVLQDGVPAGVLLVAWDRELAHLSDRAAAVVGLFAAEAAVAIERADVLSRLDELNGALARQVEALRLSDQVKSDFVSSVSHELRTPLASILGYLEILMSEEVGELTELQAEFLGIIDTNSHRLLSLIDDLLTLSGLENGKLAMRMEPVDLAELVYSEMQALRPELEERGHDLRIDVPGAPIQVDADVHRCGQVIGNILANAIKFTPEGGQIHVRLTEDAGAAQLTVEDSGIGISEDELDSLFERFYRARSATEQAIPGTGLGLAISKGIVEAHGGTLTVESELGRGSAFTVRLPASASRESRTAA
ncbi:MAG TPA: ATP-binding protein [Gaiellales bacterium]|jgi:PAS domain S-box-containing protein